MLLGKNKKNVNVVCAVIINKDKVFCVQRPDKGEVGLKWEFPGGKIEPGETMEEALKREIKEELNCDIKVNDFIETVYHEYKTFNITLHAFKCEMLHYKYELIEHIDSKWVKISELGNMDLAEADIKINLN